ncbi:MAG: TonB-dependent receptor [Phycisphaerae bacterium]|jgi:outer membrane receptor protein involved in Fe transport
MVKRLSCLLFLIVFFSVSPALAEQAGSIRGMVYDKDFDAPLAAAQVSIAETGQAVTTTDEGNFVFGQVEPGTYTLVFSKDGYTRQVKANVVVSPGRMTELDAQLSGEFTEMEEFVVQDVQIGTGTEAALLDLRMESPGLMDSISSELMSQAGASDAASALKLVAGATVQDEKYAVIRGLPDRYVVSLMNGVRLPTADADKRAVQLDQFPSAVIESIQVSKTFTPDQQGDASGGAVNIILKGIPDERILKFESGISWNNQVAGNSKFLTWKGAGLDYWGKQSIPRQLDNLGSNWDGAVGVSERGEPTDYKWALTLGDKLEIADGIKVGGFGSFSYERDSSFFDKGIDDKYWVENPGDPMTPQYEQGSPSQGNFNTSLFDVTQGSKKVKWSALGAIGIDIEEYSSLSLLYMYTKAADETATLAEDTRGKANLHHYWPQSYGPEFDNYNPNDPCHPGNSQTNQMAAPYLRTETLKYTERTTSTLQFSGHHKIPTPEIEIKNLFMVLEPEIDWVVAWSEAELYEPDKRQFGSLWLANSWVPRRRISGKWRPGYVAKSMYKQFLPAANFNMGNLQRIWKDISEEDEQYAVNFKIPFEQWTGDEGYVKFGWFRDKVSRKYYQESFTNSNDTAAPYNAPWETYWSDEFPSQNHPVKAVNTDVDYAGKQHISASYYMVDLPLCSFFNVIAGVRRERTELSIMTHPHFEEGAKLIFPDSPDVLQDYDSEKADVSFKQKDVLPSIGFVFKPLKDITLRGSYTETIARQTFKELSPISQMEFLGGDVFIGNPGLKMSALKNYDARIDYTPYEGGLISFSYFYKDINSPIEYVQRNAGFSYTTPMNYPKGKLDGWEIEIRQKMGHLWKPLDGLSLGANATFINSEVTLPEEEADALEQLDVPMEKRDMTNAPEKLYNFFLTYNMAKLGLPDTDFALFYTVHGDTLVAGAGQSNGKFVPSVYETEYGTLNMGLSQKIGKSGQLKFQVKNLLNPAIKTVYSSEYIDGDITKTSYKKGIEFSLGLIIRF